jgi:hypothetical protein
LLSLKYKKVFPVRKKISWAQWHITPAMQEANVGESQCEASPGEKERLYVKNKAKAKRAGGMTEMVECLPIKNKDLSSNPSNTRKIKKKRTLFKNKILLLRVSSSVIFYFRAQLEPMLKYYNMKMDKQ